MQEIADLERRITAALERIGRGVEGLSAAAAAMPADPALGLLKPGETPTLMLPESDFAALNEQLDEERMLTAQLNERLRVIATRESAEKAAHMREISELELLIATQSGELQRLRAQLDAVPEAPFVDVSGADHSATDALATDALANEVQSLRAARAADAAELAEIIAALNPLIEEAEHA